MGSSIRTEIALKLQDILDSYKGKNLISPCEVIGILEVLKIYALDKLPLDEEYTKNKIEEVY